MRRGTLLVLVMSVTALGCTLLTSLDGLSGGPDPDGAASEPDGSTSDALVPTDSGTDADANVSSFDPDATCPSKGGAMVNVGAFCIDSTEVTVVAYHDLEQAANAGILPAQPAFCSWNTSYAQQLAPGSSDLSPAVYIDWCDAYAFCRFSGKRLCGAVAGGPTSTTQFASPSASQWDYACTSNGANAFVYGNTYQPKTCRGADFGDFFDYPAEVRNAPGCRAPNAPFTGVYDLNGNAEEWEDACNASVDDLDRCRVRGGDRQAPADAAACASDRTSERRETSIFRGFRCCWP